MGGVDGELSLMSGWMRTLLYVAEYALVCVGIADGADDGWIHVHVHFRPLLHVGGVYQIHVLHVMASRP